MFQCQVLSARSLRLSPVTAGHQLTAPACQTCHSAKIKTAEKALPSGKPEIPSRRVRAVTVSGNDIIVSPWRDAWGLYRWASMDVANPCWRQSRAVPVVCVGSAVLPQPVLLPRPANGLRRQSTLSLQKVIFRLKKRSTECRNSEGMLLPVCRIEEEGQTCCSSAWAALVFIKKITWIKQKRRCQ